MRNDLLLREIQALREQVTQLQDEVRELRQLPSPRKLEPDSEPDKLKASMTSFGVLRKGTNTTRATL